MTIRNWIKQQESLGKPTFSYRDVKVNFSDMPEQHIMNELYRLSRQKIIQSVYKSFYTVFFNNGFVAYFPVFNAFDRRRYFNAGYFFKLVHKREEIH